MALAASLAEGSIRPQSRSGMGRDSSGTRSIVLDSSSMPYSISWVMVIGSSLPSQSSAASRQVMILVTLAG